MKKYAQRIYVLKYAKKILLSFMLGTILLFLGVSNGYSLDRPEGMIKTVKELLTLQQPTVKGRVVDESGNPMAGVNVVEQGTTNGTITDVDGNYTITVGSKNSVLSFSFVGYVTQAFSVGDQVTLNVTLEEFVSGLDEIIVIGYGTQRKSDITGAITSVDADRIRDVPALNITRALQGKTAGVEIQNIGRNPGSGSQIRVRGNRSLSASNDPLIVVDGIPFGGSINDIAADDIESIEVLKDASATVIYGSRGSNGVILITTKRGKAGALKVTYNGYYGLTNVAREYDLYNAEEFIKLRDVAAYTDFLPDEKESMLLGRETDWQKLIYQTGQTTNHELGFSGGTEKFQYSLSGGFINETFVLPGIDYSRYNMRAAIDQQLGKRVRLGITSMNSIAVTNGQSASPMWPILSLSPLYPAYELDGTMNKQPAWPTDNTYNPLSIFDEESWAERNRRHSSFNTLYAEVDLFEGMKYRANLGFDFSTNRYNNYYASDSYVRTGSESQGRVQNTENMGYTIENLLIYDKAFGNHRINITGMQSIQESTAMQSSFTGTGAAADYIQYNSFALFNVVEATSQATNYYSNWSLVSFMGRINYSLLDRYLLTVTGRSDGSSRLAEGKKWHSYPAVALAWKISQEPFMSGIDFLSNLKLRAGYGQTSNTSINPYATLGSLTRDTYSFGDQGVYGYYVNTLPNTELTWEFTAQTNIGLDFGFLSERINGSVDLYLQKTDGVLLGVALPPSQGVPGQFMKNIGATENKGLEIALNGLVFKPAIDKGFSWEINANIFLNREKITALQDPSIDKDIGNSWFVGYPASAIYDYVKVGIWQLGEEDDATVYGAKPGDIKYKDLNNDNKIDDSDRKVLGSSQPDLLGGFTSTWGFKGFDLSVVGYFRVGGMIASTMHMPNNYFNRLDGRRNGPKVDYWSPTNPTNKYPKPDMAINAARTNVLGYFDGSFLKIRSINLGYNLDRRWTRFMSPSASVRVYASVADPFILFSPYLEEGGLDPEPTNTAAIDNSALGIPGRTLVVSYGTPPVRKFLFGINVNF